MNVVAAAAFVDVSDRVMDIIKRRVQNVKKGAGVKSKEGGKGRKDSKKAVSLSHLQSTIADTMSNDAFQKHICSVVAEQVSRMRIEHFRRFRDFLRAMKRSAIKGVGSSLLDSEAQQKVFVRIRRAVLDELSSRQHAALARSMKVRCSAMLLVVECDGASRSPHCLWPCLLAALASCSRRKRLRSFDSIAFRTHLQFLCLICRIRNA